MSKSCLHEYPFEIEEYLPKSMRICNALDSNIINWWPSYANILNSHRVDTKARLQISC